LFEEAVALARDRDHTGAEEALQKTIRADPDFIEAYQLLAQLAYEEGRLDDAITYYGRTLEIDPGGNPEAYRLLAGLVYQTGDYQRGVDLLERYFSFPIEELQQVQGGEALMEKCRFALHALAHPVPFQPENLGDSVNSALNEYWPCLSVDEQRLMFTVMLPVKGSEESGGPRYQEDFFMAEHNGSAWKGRMNAGSPLNTADNEGAHSLTADGRYLFFTACNRRDGKGRCDLYLSVRKDGGWSTPVNLGSPVNTGYSEKQPSISADGRVLYFSSNRPGGKGAYDIWRSEWTPEGWSVPENLGDSVNTAGLEQSPFLHPDGKSLYFSSTGWPGMGRGDLFFTRMKGEDTWSTPKNLGYPINTYNDEIGLTVNARGDRAYFASDREESGDTDIFTFELPLAVRPVLVSYLEGRVYDARSMKGLAALIQLIDLESGEVVMEAISGQKEGDYLLALPTDRDYALNVSAEGYLFSSEHFAFRGEHSRRDPFRRDIPLERLRSGTRVVLNNIFFETDSDSLLPASRTELDRVYAFLESHPSLSVEIAGHTDNRGSPEHNQVLSERRARAVVAYLGNRGVDPSRMRPVGYGEGEPVSGNDTEEGRALNRRTELKILDTGE
jgi:outer membrane protein OmpA-like peptidoglycan-associated protein/tetratricopeptide (TPR) repeat protein